MDRRATRPEATTLDFVEDVLGGLDFLKGQKRIDPKRIGLIGHSEGGLIAPIVATRSGDVAFIVMLAGPGLPGDQILSSQQAAILRSSGVDEAKIRSSAEFQTRLMAIAKDAPDTKQALEKLKMSYEEMLKTLPEADRKALAATDAVGSQVALLATPWFRYFLSYDPRPTLARVTCPILAINGENDLQVPCKENLEAIDRAVRSGRQQSNQNPTDARAQPPLPDLQDRSPVRIRLDRGNLRARRSQADWRMGA